MHMNIYMHGHTSYRGFLADIGWYTHLALTRQKSRGTDWLTLMIQTTFHS